MVTILNRLGHCESYTFALEMESSLDCALTDSSQHLTPHVVTGEESLVFHHEWDNTNKFTTNVLGSNFVFYVYSWSNFLDHDSSCAIHNI